MNSSDNDETQVLPQFEVERDDEFLNSENNKGKKRFDYKRIITIFILIFVTILVLFCAFFIIPASIVIQSDKSDEYNTGYMIFKNESSSTYPVRGHMDDSYYQPRLSLKSTGVGGVWYDFGEWFRPKYMNTVIIALHGFPQHANAFPESKFFNKLRSNFTIFAWNQRGCFPSDIFINRTMYDIQHYYDDLIQLIDSIKKDSGREKTNIALIGYDWGGYFGYLFASKYPDLVDALVTIAAPHPSLSNNFKYAEWMMNDNDPIQRYLKNDYQELTNELTNGGLEDAKMFLKKTDALATTTFIQNLLTIGNQTDNAASVPTLAILGAQDVFLDYKDYAEHLSDVHYSISISAFNSSHFMLNDVPDKVAKIIHAFLVHT
mmetsp:Transcript_2434/g.3540  ORF Transcript_2434/g.3540 Transcript_2434/m.3540 type:complete len:375 (+) Transcript_2434:1-1125(+)